MDARTSPRGRARRRGAAALRVVAGLVALAVAALLLLLAFVDTAALEDRVRREAVPRLSASLGTPVRIDRLDARVLPRPQVRLEGVAVGGTSAEPPLLEARSGSFQVKVWPLLRSLGKDVQLSSVALEGPTLNLVRRRDGRWNFQAVGGGTSDRQISVSELALRDGTLRLVDQAGGSSVALQRVSGRATGLGAAGEVSVDLKGALAAARENLALRLRGGPGGWRGSVSLSEASVEVLRGALPAGMRETVSGGTLSLQGDLVAASPLRARGDLRVEDLRLRGSPARASARWQLKSGKSLEALVEGLKVEGPGIDLGGSGSLATAPLRGRFDLMGRLLDLDALTAALPEGEESGGRDPGVELLPEGLRRQLSSMDMRGRVDIARVVSGNLTAKKVAGAVELRGGKLVLDRAAAQIYGGMADLSGTSLDLSSAKPAWKLAASLEGLDLGAAMKDLSGGEPLRGRATGRLELSGAGNQWSELVSTVTGDGRLRIDDGTLTGADLAARIAEPLGQALTIAGRSSAAGRARRVGSGATALRDLDARFEVKDGWIRLEKPLKARTDFGSVELAGAVGLNKKLDLAGTALLSPQYVERVSGGSLRPSGPTELPLQLGGDLSGPAVQLPQPRELAAALVQQRPRQQLEGRARQLEEEARKRAGRTIRDLLPGR